MCVYVCVVCVLCVCMLCVCACCACVYCVYVCVLCVVCCMRVVSVSVYLSVCVYISDSEVQEAQIALGYINIYWFAVETILTQIMALSCNWTLIEVL